MISLAKDANNITALGGTLNTDGLTVVAITANPSNNSLRIADDTTGSNHPFVDAQRDVNRVPTLWAVSSADGLTPIPIYADSDGKLLVDSQ